MLFQIICIEYKRKQDEQDKRSKTVTPPDNMASTTITAINNIHVEDKSKSKKSQIRKMFERFGGKWFVPSSVQYGYIFCIS